MASVRHRAPQAKAPQAKAAIDGAIQRRRWLGRGDRVISESPSFRSLGWVDGGSPFVPTAAVTGARNPVTSTPNVVWAAAR